MRRFLAAVLVPVGVAWSQPSRADDEGGACQITADCGEGLRCIDGACVSIASGKIVAPVIVRHERSAGDRAWISDGKGYVLDVVVGDITATAVAGGLVAIALASGQGWFAFAALFPTTLTASIIHAVHGRGGPAAVSFFGWAAVPPTLGFFAGLAGLASGSSQTVAIVGYTIGIGAAAGLTTLDAFFARSVGPHPRGETSLSIMPTVAPARGGFTAGIAGTF
ncbi:MAG TPA: hypothetical protein VGH87_11570 [Polyangiaceae bacterium]